MSWFLPGKQPYDAHVADQPPPDWGDRLSAASTMRRITDDQYNRAQVTEMELAGELTRSLPEDLQAGVYDDLGRLGKRPNQGKLFEALGVAAARDPVRYGKIGEDNVPFDQKSFDALVLQRRQREYDAAASVLGAAPEGSWGAEMLGDSWAAMTDEAALATLPFGVPGRAALGFKIAGEAALGAGSELLTTPRRLRVAGELDVPEPNVAADVGMAGLFAGGLTGIVGGIAAGARHLGYRGERAAAGQVGREAGTGAVAQEQAVDAAASDMAKGNEVAPKEQVPGAGFVSVADAGKGYTVVVGSDGEAIRREGTRAWRNNNPGNIEYGDFARSHGAIGTDGRFAVFPTYQDGRRAKAALLWNTKSYRGKTIAGAIRRYAPPGENNTPAYIRAITDALGVPADTPMAKLTPAQRNTMMTAMERVEGFRPGRENGVQVSDLPRGGDTFTGGVSDTGGGPDYGPTRRGYTVGDTVRVGDELRVGVRYEVVDADALTRASGRFQPRDRSQVNSDAWVAATAAALDPAELMPAPNAATGTPLVGPDNMIESGNGRFMAIERAYQLHLDRADAYRAAIEAAGFDIPEGVERPVLVARRTTEMDDNARAALTVAAQDSGVAQMTPSEIAGAMARDLTPERLAQLDPAKGMTDEANRGFVRSLLDTLPKAVRSGMYDGRDLTADAKRMLSRAVFSRAWDAPELIRAYVSAEDSGELRQLMSALEQAAPAWAAMRAEIDAGRLRPEFDITGHVAEALTLITRAREGARAGEAGVNSLLEEMLADVDMLDGALSPLTVALVHKAWTGGRAAPAAQVSNLLIRYADEVRQIGGQDGALFAAPGPAEALRSIDPDAFKDLPDDFGTPRAGAVRAEPTRPLPEQAFDDGADAPEVDAEIEVAQPPSPRRDPNRPEYRDTRGKDVFYHGSRSADLTEGIYEGSYSSLNYYGQGLYTSDAVAITEGYNKGGGLYRISERTPVKIFDMEQPIPDWLVRGLEDDELVALALDGVDAKPTNVRELYDEIRAASQYEQRPADDVQDLFYVLNDRIVEAGFGALQHDGGLRTGKASHTVRVYLEPWKSVAADKVDPAEFRMPEPQSVPALTEPAQRTPLSQTVRDLTNRALAAVAPDAATRRALDDMAAEFGDTAIDLGEGRVVAISDLTDEMSQDSVLENVIDSCITGGPR